MTKQTPPDDPDGCDAATRVAELRRLFASIRYTLDHMIQEIGEPDVSAPKALHSKLQELQTVHLRVIAAEDSLRTQQLSGDTSDDIDIEAIRSEISSQFDRLRQSYISAGLPEGIEPCAACRAALSL